jgi:5-(carboxyamino)imidazole ribonucleotide mutase
MVQKKPPMEGRKPLVGIIMGSDSDLPTMRPAADILDTLGVPWEMDIVSAHRTPDKLYEYARSAASRGFKVIIAGAGGAAHLPGMTASLTDLPVIGVPVRTKTMDGLDSLLSIVQMPGGVPVATVAIDGGRNAGLLAARMLGMSDPALANRLRQYREGLRDEVLAKADSLRAGAVGRQASPGEAQVQWAGLDGSPGSKA